MAGLLCYPFPLLTMPIFPQMNSACTFGSWHPLAAEKLMALDMNMADDMSVFQFGILRIRRPDKLLCGFNFFGY